MLDILPKDIQTRLYWIWLLSSPPLRPVFPHFSLLSLLFFFLLMLFTSLEIYAVSSRNSWQLIADWSCGSVFMYAACCVLLFWWYMSAVLSMFLHFSLCVNRSYEYILQTFSNKLLSPNSAISLFSFYFLCISELPCTSVPSGRIRAIRWLLLTENYSGLAEAAAVINLLTCHGSVMKYMKQYRITFIKLQQSSP